MVHMHVRIVMLPIQDRVDRFFFNDTATTEIYTLSLHDALPISTAGQSRGLNAASAPGPCLFTPSTPRCSPMRATQDRKSTRLNSSHLVISYAVFCLKKKTIDLSL